MDWPSRDSLRGARIGTEAASAAGVSVAMSAAALLVFALFGAALLTSGCVAPRGAVECRGLLGDEHRALPPGAQPEAEARLADARRKLEAFPGEVDHVIWVGRRFGYLWRMNEAIDVFSGGLVDRPEDPALLRHRGHRSISLRQFAAAQRDLELAAATLGARADEIEPDGQPNAHDIPLTTLGFNVWYHLALVRGLQHDFESSVTAWEQAARHTRGYYDNRVAVAYWQYIALRRLGRDAEAAALLGVLDVPVDGTLESEIIENFAYHRLLQLFAGRTEAEEIDRWAAGRAQDEATVGYGIGMWHALRGDRSAAENRWRRVVGGASWPAFGFIAAEVELAALRDGVPAR